MAQLIMMEKQRQLARLIHHYIQQFHTALHADQWREIQKINHDVNRLLTMINQAPAYKKALQSELAVLRDCLTTLQQQGLLREQRLSTQIAQFHDQKEGLRAYQEVDGWQ